MNSIKEIMTENPIYLSGHANVNKARMIMADKSIRHIPVKDLDRDRLVGMISQKAVLSNAIKIINNRGLEQLEHTEKSMEVSSIMNPSPAVFEVSDQLIEVAKNLLVEKHGCVAIEEKGKLVGVITSNDFVKLAIQQLSQT